MVAPANCGWLSTTVALLRVLGHFIANNKVPSAVFTPKYLPAVILIPLTEAKEASYLVLIIGREGIDRTIGKRIDITFLVLEGELLFGINLEQSIARLAA